MTGTRLFILILETWLSLAAAVLITMLCVWLLIDRWRNR